jgi:hypothetical protein
MAAIPLQYKLVDRFMRTHAHSRVFSSILYQDVMVLDFPEKDPAQPCCKKTSPHKARRTPHGETHTAVCVRPLARPRACTGAPIPGRRPRRRLSGSWSMQVGAAAAAHLRNVFARIRRRTDTARVFAPQVRSMAAGADGGHQVRTEL